MHDQHFSVHKLIRKVSVIRYKIIQHYTERCTALYVKGYTQPSTLLLFTYFWDMKQCKRIVEKHDTVLLFICTTCSLFISLLGRGYAWLLEYKGRCVIGKTDQLVHYYCLWYHHVSKMPFTYYYVTCNFVSSLVRELCYTARRFMAPEAKEFGLVR